MSLLGRAEESQFGTSKLWQTRGKSKETKEGQLLLGIRRKLGKVVLNKFIEEVQEFQVVGFLTGCKRWLAHRCYGTKESSFLFLKAEDKIPM